MSARWVLVSTIITIDKFSNLWIILCNKCANFFNSLPQFSQPRLDFHNYHNRRLSNLWTILCNLTCANFFNFLPQLSQHQFSTIITYGRLLQAWILLCNLRCAHFSNVSPQLSQQCDSLHLTATRPQQGPESLTALLS